MGDLQGAHAALYGKAQQLAAYVGIDEALQPARQVGILVCTAYTAHSERQQAAMRRFRQISIVGAQCTHSVARQCSAEGSTAASSKQRRTLAQPLTTSTEASYLGT